MTYRHLLQLMLCLIISTSLSLSPLSQVHYLAPRGISHLLTPSDALKAVPEQKPSSSRKQFLFLSLKQVFETAEESFQPMASVYQAILERLIDSQTSRRTFHTLLVGSLSSAWLVLTGCDKLSFSVPKEEASSNPEGSTTFIAGNPIILDMEKYFSEPNQPLLQDAEQTDTSIVFLLKVTNLYPQLKPNVLHLTAKTIEGKEVVLDPFAPLNGSASFDPVFRQTISFKEEDFINEGTETLAKQLNVRVYLVKEPSASGDVFSNVIDLNKFPSDQFRPIRENEQIIFTFKGAYVNAQVALFTANEAQTDIITIKESVTHLRNVQGNPEPGNLIEVIQNPLNIENANDGTLRLRFETETDPNAAIKPENVLVSLFDNETGEFLNSYFLTLSDPNGLNEFDISPVKFTGEEISSSTELRVVAQNSGVGLTPADPDPDSTKEILFLRNADPVMLSTPLLSPVFLSSPIYVELVNGTRLLRLRVNNNALPFIQALTPSFHYLKFRISNSAFNAATNPDVPQVLEYTTAVKIPSRTALPEFNVLEVPYADANAPVPLTGTFDYFVEIPEEAFSSVEGSALLSVQVGNTREGYEAMLAPEQFLTTSLPPSGGSGSAMGGSPYFFTSSAQVGTEPEVSNVSVKDNLVSLTIDPKGDSSSLIESGHNITLTLANLSGETIDFSTFVELPKKLVGQSGGEVEELAENDQPHLFQIKLNDPAVAAFIEQGSVILKSIQVNNTSRVMPSGPIVLEELSPGISVGLPSSEVTEIPSITSVMGDPYGLGDNSVNVTLKVNGSNGSVSSDPDRTPQTLRFTFLLRKPGLAEQIQVVQERPLAGAHQTDRAQDQNYSFTIEEATVLEPFSDVASVLESVTVTNVDADLNESASVAMETELTLNPQRATTRPSIVSLEGMGTETAQIQFTIPTQNIIGNVLPSSVYPNGKPNVIVEAFTTTGMSYEAFIQDTDVVIPDPVNAPLVGQVAFNFGTGLTQSGIVSFTLKTAPPSAAFSARSTLMSGDYLIAAGVVVLGLISKQIVEKDSQKILTLLNEDASFSSLKVALKNSQTYQKLATNGADFNLVEEELLRLFLPTIDPALQSVVGADAKQVEVGPVNRGIDLSL